MPFVVLIVIITIVIVIVIIVVVIVILMCLMYSHEADCRPPLVILLAICYLTLYVLLTYIVTAVFPGVRNIAVGEDKHGRRGSRYGSLG